MIPNAFRMSLCMAIGAALTLGAQIAIGQVAGGMRAGDAPVQRFNAAVSQLGISRCAPVMQQAGAFLLENASAQFVFQPLGPDTNRWPTAVTIEGSYPIAGKPAAANQTRLTTLLVAPAGSCSGLYTQVIFWPEACATLKTRVFGSFTNDRPLLAKIRQSEANPGLQVYLMPAGTGCVSVKKELIG